MSTLFKKYRDIILYLFFGICTTVINVIVYWIVAYPIGMDIVPGTVIAWFCAVSFAYITNRRWVFCSNSKSISKIGKEALFFLGGRITTGIVDISCMFMFADIFGINDVAVKFGANVLVIILNYIISKWIVFK